MDIPIEYNMETVAAYECYTKIPGTELLSNYIACVILKDNGEYEYVIEERKTS